MFLFTVLYGYRAAKDEYSNYDFGDCTADWATIWRFVGYTPLLLELSFIIFYTLLKMCKNCTNSENSENRLNAASKRKINLYCLYIVVFVVCFIFAGIRRFYNVFGTISDDSNVSMPIEPPFWIGCLHCVFESCYGIGNCAIYFWIWSYRHSRQHQPLPSNEVESVEQ